ncbi:12393_t:CDS:2 [Ambispora gerdemannii]|uniref:12393_t:CDS:1 n=1 Tax=Ambispora gerdemannii TaxID=144530 RepID=A0A9N8VJY7_9GLOM|nr:12393_t:CDS:2 [Ambispora gerdemannii]
MSHAQKPSIGGESSTSSEDVYFEAIADEDNITPRRTREQLTHQHSSSFDSMGSSRFESVYMTPRDSNCNSRYINANEILGIDNGIMDKYRKQASTAGVGSSNSSNNNGSVGGDDIGAGVGGNDFDVVKAAEEAFNNMRLEFKSDQWFSTSNDLTNDTIVQLELQPREQLKMQHQQLHNRRYSNQQQNIPKKQELQQKQDLPSSSNKNINKKTSKRSSKLSHQVIIGKHENDVLELNLSTSQLNTCDKVFLFIGTSIVFFLAVLDINVVAMQVPIIVGEFHSAQDITWLVTSYNLGSDVLPVTRQRLLFNTLLNGVFSIAMVSGPLIGGLFADRLSWRWTFYMNAPLRSSTSITSTTTDKLKSVDWIGSFLLFTGILLILLAIGFCGTKKYYEWISVPIIGLFSVGLCVIIAFGIHEAKFATDPIIPTIFLKDYGLRAIFGAFFFLGWVQIVITYYIPIFYQYVREKSAIDAAIAFLPYIGGVVVMSWLSGVTVSRRRLFRWFIVLGSVFLIVGVALQSTFDLSTDIVRDIVGLSLAGMGVGVLFMTLPVACQAAALSLERREQYKKENISDEDDNDRVESQRNLGILTQPQSTQLATITKNNNSVNNNSLDSSEMIITTLGNFFKSAGLVFGMSISGALFNNIMSSEISALNDEQQLIVFNGVNTALIKPTSIFTKFPPELQLFVRNAVQDGVSRNFTVSFVMAAVGLVFALFIRH